VRVSSTATGTVIRRPPPPVHLPSDVDLHLRPHTCWGPFQGNISTRRYAIAFSAGSATAPVSFHDSRPVGSASRHRATRRWRPERPNPPHSVQESTGSRSRSSPKSPAAGRGWTPAAGPRSYQCNHETWPEAARRGVRKEGNLVA
jgi:hypothetical protein